MDATVFFEFRWISYTPQHCLGKKFRLMSGRGTVRTHCIDVRTYLILFNRNSTVLIVICILNPSKEYIIFFNNYITYIISLVEAQ